MDSRPNLETVAKARAVQTWWQSLGIDIAVGLAFFLMANLDAIDANTAWMTLGFLAGKTVVQTIAAWVIRRYVDRSGFAPDGQPL